MGVARPRHAVGQQTAIFLTDDEASRLAGHPGRADAIGVLAGPGFDASRLRAASHGAVVYTGDARGKAEHPELLAAKTTLIAVTASFGGLALFIAIFVVMSTMGLSIQQREREIALLRAVAGTPGQIRRMIAWEAVIVGLVGSLAGLWPGAMLGRALTRGLIRHDIAPPNLTVSAGWLPIAAAVAGGVLAALLAVLGAGRRAARVSPTHALTQAAVEPRLLGPGRVIGGLIALAGATPLFAVSATTGSPETAAATSEMTALFLVVAVGCLGPLVARLAAGILGPPLARLAPVGGFLASANLRTSTRRFSSASTPLMLTVAMSCTLLFSTTTQDHAVSQERHAGVSSDLAITSSGPGLPPAALAEARATPGVRSAVGLTPTTLGPSLGISDETIPAQILDGGKGGGLDAGVTAGSLTALHGDTIALGRRRADAAHARVGDRVPLMLGDGTRSHATVVAIYSRELAFGEALLAPELAAAHQTTPLLGTILVSAGNPAAVGRRLRALARRVSRAAGERPRVDHDRDRRRPGDQPLARAAVRGDHLRLHVDRGDQHAGDDRAEAWPRARAPAARRRNVAPGAVDGTLGGRPDRHDGPRPRAGDRGDGAAAAQPRADRQPPAVCAPRPARGDPRRFGAPGGARAGAADAASAARTPGRGDRHRRVGLSLVALAAGKLFVLAAGRPSRAHRSLARHVARLPRFNASAQTGLGSDDALRACRGVRRVGASA